MISERYKGRRLEVRPGDDEGSWELLVDGRVACRAFMYDDAGSDESVAGFLLDRLCQHVDEQRPRTVDDLRGRPLSEMVERYSKLEHRDAYARAIEAGKANGDYAGIDPSRDIIPEPEPLTVDEHLELLATAQAAANRVTHPTLVHHAVRAGARLEDVAAARGVDLYELAASYAEWAASQRALWHESAGRLGLPDAEFLVATRATEEVPAP